MKKLNVTCAQMNPTLGDLRGNAQKILHLGQTSWKEGSDLLVFSELALLGYAPNDLLERPEVLKQQNKELSSLVSKLPSELGVVLGCLREKNGHLYNGAVFIYKNQIKKEFYKSLLPSYDVFDETRHFSKGELKKNSFSFKKKKILVSICEDIWALEKAHKYPHDPFEKINKNFDLMLCLNASPYHPQKQKLREKLVGSLAQKFSCDFYYVNQVGAQDELIFDGQSFAANRKGQVFFRAPAFEESCQVHTSRKKPPSRYEGLFEALCLGIKDYVHKSGFQKVHLGLSGGIDSGLVLSLASFALGPKNVCGIALPGPYSSKLSFDLAKKISKNLGTTFISCDIKSTYQDFLKNFDQSFEHKDFSLVNENAQARLRALYLMAYSNKESSLLLATSNKSELAVGYSTLYGDQCGALMPIGDLVKTEVFEVCRWINKNVDHVIPQKMISRPPTAELRANQKDSDSLPDYKNLDGSVNRIITQQKNPRGTTDQWLLQKSFQSEFKRWQAPPILKVSPHAFGRGRRMPLAHRFRLK